MPHDKPKQTDSASKERIAKRMAAAGLCSRREAERWIADGRVAINGQIIDSPAITVGVADVVKVDGRVLSVKQPTRLFLYHKPDGLVTTHKDEKGRDTVFESLPGDLPRVVSVGRLDLNTEGLLLLTTDGELSRYLELPSTGWSRQYRVRVFGKLDHEKLAALKDGITIEGRHYKSIVVSVETEKGMNSWLHVTLKEGKNREIRKVMAAVGLQVNRLIRIAYGPFTLGKLAKGTVKEVEDNVMRHQLAGFFSPSAKKSGRKK